MSIIRSAKPESNFYILNKRISEDRRLSWQARGMLVFLLGKPDNWEVSIAHLIRETEESGKKSGRDAVYNIIAELEACGYMSKGQARVDGGKMGKCDYYVHESPPLPDNPDAAPLPGLPYTANPTLTSNEEQQELREDKKRKAKFDPATAELPSCVPRDTWLLFCKHRGRLDKKITDIAFDRMMKNLEAWHAEGQNLEKIIGVSIDNGWTGLFPEKNKSQQQRQAPANSLDARVNYDDA